MAVQRVKYCAGRALKEGGLAMDRFGSRMGNDVAYTFNYSRHRTLMPLYGQIPQAASAWVAPNSTLAGSVILSKYATVWYGVTMRAE